MFSWYAPCVLQRDIAIIARGIVRDSSAPALRCALAWRVANRSRRAALALQRVA